MGLFSDAGFFAAAGALTVPAVILGIKEKPIGMKTGSRRNWSYCQ